MHHRQKSSIPHLQFGAEVYLLCGRVRSDWTRPLSLGGHKEFGRRCQFICKCKKFHCVLSVGSIEIERISRGVSTGGRYPGSGMDARCTWQMQISKRGSACRGRLCLNLVDTKPFSAAGVYQVRFDNHILGQSLLSTNPTAARPSCRSIGRMPQACSASMLHLSAISTRDTIGLAAPKPPICGCPDWPWYPSG